jgi:hypothetical protein
VAGIARQESGKQAAENARCYVAGDTGMSCSSLSSFTHEVNAQDGKIETKRRCC